MYRNLLSRSSVFLTILLLAVCCIPAQAQPGDEFVELTGLTRASHFAAVEAWQVNINTAPFEKQTNALEIELFDGQRHQIQRTDVEVRGEGDLVWRGRFADDGQAILTLKNGLVVGVLFAPDGVYELTTSAAGQVLQKLDISAFPPCELEHDHVDPAVEYGFRGTSRKALEIPNSMVENTVNIDIMTLYTPQARVGAGGTAQIQATAQSSIDISNTAFTNSDTIARFTLVHTAEVSYNDSGNLASDRNWVQANSTAQSLRDQHNADLVGLLVESGGGCGIAFLMGNEDPVAFNPKGYQVTVRSCAVGNLSYPHEHGHNLGLQHNPQNGAPVSSATYAWSYGHYNNGNYRTVMSYSNPCSSGCTRQPYFSNPDISFQGAVTGIANSRDNARTIDLIAPITAQYRNGGNSAPAVAISAPINGSSADLGTSVSFAGTANDDNDGDISSSLSWSSSLDGNVGSGASFSNSGLSVGSHTITASATDSASATGSAAITLTINDPNTNGPQTAVYDSGLGAPQCTVAGSSCDSTTLLVGRNSKGPEPNQPNTLGSCTDGNSGSFHSDESNDQIVVSMVGGGDFTAGATVRIDATVWAYSTFGSDHLDLYYAANANNPSWVFIATLEPTQGGAQTLSTTYTLPSGSLQAVRANFRYNGSASSCGTGNYDDTDDLVFAVGGGVSNTAPTASISAPSNGSSVSQGASVTFTGSANDNEDGNLSSSLSWSSSLDGNIGSGASFSTSGLSVGSHTVTASVSDSGGLSASAQVSVTVTSSSNGPQTATFNSGLGVPSCLTAGSSCDSATLFVGRNSKGPEPNQPNTLGSCSDGNSGNFHSDESNDKIVVSTLNNADFSAGATVTIEATVWAYSSFGSDHLDLYYAADANNPSWVFIATLEPTQAGAQTLSTTYTLPSGSLQAVRANFRYNGSASSCPSGNYNDHDDLVFAVNP